MDDIPLMLIAFGFVFTILALISPIRKIIFSVLSMIFWFPLSAAVAADPTSSHFWVVLFGLGMFMFAWTFILIVEKITGRAMISGGEAEE